MSATRPLNEDIVKPGLDAVFVEKFDEFQTKAFASVRDTSVFRQVNLTGQATHTEDVMSDGGYWTERGEMEESDSVSVKTGYQVVYDPGEWAFQLPISRTLWENDMHGVVKDAIRRRARKGRATQERNGMLIFNRSFDTAYVGGDSKPLFSATHTLLGGDTFSNLMTPALAEASLESAIQRFISMPDQDGIPYGEMPAVLLVPPALFPEAVRITKSEQRPGIHSEHRDAERAVAADQ